jgi:tetratricopeptide (TPR) repeat protein
MPTTDSRPAGIPAPAVPDLAGLRAQSAALYQQHRYPEAEQACRSILALEPRSFDALIMLGALAMERGDLTSAVEWFHRAIDVNDSVAHAHNNLGIALTQLGRSIDAVASFDKAIALWPGFAEAHCNRGIALEQLGQDEQALASIERAVAMEPRMVRAHSNRGTVLQKLRRPDSALDSYDAALRVQPGYVAAHSKRAAALLELGRPVEALASCERALALDPGFAAAFVNRAAALRRLTRFEEALATCEQAAARFSDDAMVQNARGGALCDLGRLEEALDAFRRAMSLEPRYAEAHWNASLCLLRMGRFREGWALFEWRKRLPVPLGARALPQPLWTGAEALAGRSLYIHAEQGFGDTLQFARYVPLTAARGANVQFAVPRQLLGLLRNLDPAVRILAADEAAPITDFHCPLLSLPLAFATDLETIPASRQYLRSDPELVRQWQARVGNSASPRIGLAWSGNPAHANDANRSIPLEDLMANLPGDAQYFSLQKDIRPSDHPALRGSRAPMDLSDRITDFRDTAALCECMDLVITVDTSVAHLSGALGRETWILLPSNSDWRWMSGAETRWYPTMTLYRQDRPGIWQTPLQRVAEALYARRGLNVRGNC